MTERFARRWVGLAAELARDEYTTAELLRRHKPDAERRCQACTTGGSGTPEKQWPCTLHALATDADRIRRANEAASCAAPPTAPGEAERSA